MQNGNTLNIEDPSIVNSEFTVLDFETTGTSPRFSKVIEIGMVKVKNLEIVDTYQSFVNPQSPIPYHITGITGIDDSHVIDAPVFDLIVDDIKSFIGETVLVAHNLQFDNSFLISEFAAAGKELPNYTKLCTLKLARKLLPELKSKSLASLVEHFGIVHKDVHRALGDASVTAKVLLHLIDMAVNEYEAESVEDIVNLTLPAGAGGGMKVIKKSLVSGYDQLPDKPGVYFFRGRNNEILYIGKAKSLKKRVKNYFLSNAPKKTKKIVRSAHSLDFQTTNTELVALVAEAELIKRENPPLNAQLKKYSQNHFIKVEVENKFPTLKYTSVFQLDGNDYFGPFTKRETAHFLIDIASKTYKLRECKDKDFEKSKGCYLSDIERCFAPCIEANKIDDVYKLELKRVYEFIAGNNSEAITRMANKMKQLSADKKYEEAIEYRDAVQALLNQIDKTAVMAEPVNKANALIKVEAHPNNEYILLLEGRVFIKDYFVDTTNDFGSALDDYYSATINMFNDEYKKDLEKTKITLNWLVNNRHRVKVYYLKDFKSKKDLFNTI